MKKLITSLFVFLAIAISMQAQPVAGQSAYNNYRVANTLTGIGNVSSTELDSMYVTISCRNGKYESMAVNSAGVLSTLGVTSSSYAPQDSVTWNIVKGAAIGTTPRVRFINQRTGEYLYMGTKGGTTTVAYVAPKNDPFNGVKDFQLNDQGTDSKATYYYYITNGTNQFFNDAVGAVNVKSANQGWKFIPRPGLKPKPTILRPTVDLVNNDATAPFAGGSINLKASITKVEGTDLLGTTLLYRGTTLVDTLHLDASGNVTYNVAGLKYGKEYFTVVYSGDAVYGPEDMSIVVEVGPDPTAKSTKVELTIPATSEVHKNVTLDIAVKTSTDDIVASGVVNVYVNDILKNSVQVDVLGMGAVTFPNLLVGTENIKALYVGDKMLYLDSDTARTSCEITPSTASVKPYPVYFDLCDQPEIKDWIRNNVTTATARPHSKSFPLDSLAGIVISDTLTQVYKVTYNALGYTYDKFDNTYNRADNISFAIGTNRPKFVKFKTPWLNEGSYNVFLSHRVSSSALVKITSVTMDEKELYFPNEEMYNRILSSYNYGTNTRRQWNAKGHSGNMAMNYLGSVKLDNSNTHTLRIDVDDTGYNAAEIMDMLQFIPVDMDSLSINLPAATSLAKKYFPMFDWVGFARQPDYVVDAVPTTYADFTNFAIPYQVTDQTDWGTKFSHTIDSIGLTKRVIGTDEYVANYVTIYRAEDQWTRVAEGYADDLFNYTCELPRGDYYYETINYTDLGDGAQDYRTFISSGKFSIGETAVKNQKTSNISAYTNANMLIVKGIVAGAKISVTDITGKQILNAVSNSDVFTRTLRPSMYIVKVVSGNDNKVTKVIVR